MGYRPALDGLRAVAIGLVLLEHTGLELFDGGNSGVVIFFVLSGFLITKLMLEEWDRSQTLNVGAFYGRRAVRILPAPMVMALVVFALSWHIYPDDVNARRYLWFELFMVVAYLTNLRPLLFGDGSLWGARFAGGDQSTFMAHTWTLSIEEHFYLVWPWLFRWGKLPARSPQRVVAALVTFTALITVGRYVIDQYGDPDVVSLSLFTFDGFALGAGLAFMIHAGVLSELRQALTSKAAFVFCSLVVVADLLFRNQAHDDPAPASETAGYQYWFLTTVGLASVILIAYLYDRPNGLAATILSLPLVVWLGQLSYSLYLWHVPVQVYFNRDRFPTWSLWQIVVVEQALTLAAAFGSYKLVELPATRLRKRFVVARS